MRIAIVALGYSSKEFLDVCKTAGGASALFDEVWGINAIGDVIRCDLVFHMDDVRIQQIRADAKPDSNIARMLKWLKNPQCDVITSRAHPDYPRLKEFPLEDVLSEIGGIAYFNNTAAYAIAYAIYKQVDSITLFGMDYTYENAHHAEKGRGCAEYWCGQAMARGIPVYTAGTSSLLDSDTCNDATRPRLYGYDTIQPIITATSNGGFFVGFDEVESMPTAEQIEAAYDHSKPTSKQHLINRGE